MNVLRARRVAHAAPLGKEPALGRKLQAMSCGRQEVCSAKLWAAPRMKSDRLQ